MHKNEFLSHAAEFYFISVTVNRPLGSLQVVVGLFELSDVFVQLLLDAARLSEVVLQHRDLLVALSVLVLEALLEEERQTLLITSCLIYVCQQSSIT